jgi:hypothetical protein
MQARNRGADASRTALLLKPSMRGPHRYRAAMFASWPQGGEDDHGKYRVIECFEHVYGEEGSSQIDSKIPGPEKNNEPHGN